MKEMQEAVAANLTQCCEELLEWSNTAVLCSGKVREIAYGIREFTTGSHLSIVESEIKQQTMNAYVASANTMVPAHWDDLAVDVFADAMKAKMAVCRAKGKGGWDDPDDCGIQYLIDLLLTEVLYKKDVVDIGNYVMMLFNRGVTVLPTYEPSVIILEDSDVVYPIRSPDCCTVLGDHDGIDHDFDPNLAEQITESLIKTINATRND